MNVQKTKTLIALTFTAGLMPILLALFIVDSNNVERLVPKHALVQVALNGGAR